MQTRKLFASPLSILILIFLASPLVQAAVVDGSDEDMAYEDIIRDLSKERKTAANTSRAAVERDTSDSLDNVMMHGGVGLTQMFSTVNYGGSRSHLAQQGIQATLGIDLFSENWLAEGSARNFSSQEYSGTNVSLKEFDLKVIYHNRFAPKLGLRLGGGLAARYMHIARNGSANDYTTPSSVLSAGVELLAAKAFSVAAEVSNRSSLIGETIDRSSYDMTLRVDANF